MRPMFRPVARLAALALAALVLAGCKSEIYSGLAERDINEMITVLATNGISADRAKAKDGSFALSVDGGEASQAIALLSARGLPRPRYQSLGDVFESKRMVSTPFEERARFMHAVNQELAHSLTQIAGVVSARVHVMMPEENPLQRAAPAPRASVFLYHRPDVSVREYVPVVKSLVVNAVNGLAYEDVAVALFPAGSPIEAGAGGGALSILRNPNHAGLVSLVVIGVGFALFFWARGRTDGTATPRRT